MTGHSHQAWPDASREGQIAAWDDAARLVDKKWDRVFGEIIPELQSYIAARLGTKRAGDLALAPNTHELVFRLASCFPPRSTILSTDSEFHSLRRQLDRFEEEGSKVVRVGVEEDADGFADRFIAAAIEHRPAWAALSYVTFTTSRVIEAMPKILEALARENIPVLVDAYHAFNVLELEVDRWPAGDVFICGGGYKYAECGEGVCFMLLPKNAERYRPLTTGWFSHFESLDRPNTEVKRRLEYGGGGYRFFGATFDPTSYYRALYVMRFMNEQQLTPAVLTAQSRSQTQKIIDSYDHHALADYGLVLATPAKSRGGFVSIHTSRSKELEHLLDTRGVACDVRGHLLRLGPAPYLFEREIDRAMDILAACARS